MVEQEVYFNSILIREDWMSFFLRFSLPETIQSPSAPPLSGVVGMFTGERPDDIVFMDLPQLSTVPDYQVRALLWRRIRICCTQFDLKDERYNREIRIRYETIQELISVCAAGDGDIFNFSDSLEDCLRMIGHILFRPLPFPQKVEYNALDIEMPFLDPDWDYLELVHEFFMKLITCPHIRIECIRQNITDAFLRNYLYLFLSQDIRERSMVRLVVHYLYGRLPRRRPLVRKVFAEMLSNVISLNSRVDGVDDILTVYNSIVCGFMLPIKEEHVHFLKHCILPLHKLSGLLEFASTLTRCVLLFVTRQPSLCVPVVNRAFR